MSARDARRSGSDRLRTSRAGSRSSVVGSRLNEASGRVRGRGLPLGGIREEGLKVADGALPEGSKGSGSSAGRGRRMLRAIAIVSGSLAGILLVVAVALAVLSHTPAFSITSIETFDTEHVSAEDIALLLDIEEGTTLLNVDTTAVERSVMRNPWISSVEVQTVFPDKLLIRPHERKVKNLVAMGSGGMCWLLGDDHAWIEPLRLEVSDDMSSGDAALAQAESMGVVLVTDVPGTVEPVAGSPATDPVLDAVAAYEGELSDGFMARVASFSAPDEEGISCILDNGVEVSLGGPNNIASKEAVAQQILQEYEGQVTYVNVRTPSRPTYRRVDSEFVKEGTGATGTSVDTQNDFAKLNSTRRKDGDENGVASEAADESTENGDVGSSEAYGYDDQGDSSL